MGYLFPLFVIVPIIEIGLFISIGGRIGLWPTLAIVIATALLGSFLVKSQGSAVIRGGVSAVREARFPAAEIAHGAMVLLGGALLLTPGFLTDLVGLALMVPSVREKVRVYGSQRLKARGDVIDL